MTSLIIIMSYAVAIVLASRFPGNTNEDPEEALDEWGTKVRARK